MRPAPPRDPAGLTAPDSPRWEVADVFRLYGDAYRAAQPLPESHHKVMDDIARCRTAALGGHVERCDACAFEQPAYNSCHNRHCPKCQALAKAKWVEARRMELLPTGYFHTVFTLPHELNPLALGNKRVVFGRFFQSVSAALQDFGRRVLGGRIGFTAILHTWDQKLLDHIHVHCIIPGGALSPDQQHWLPSEERFLFDVLELSAEFRSQFVDALQHAFDRGELRFPGDMQPLADPAAFAGLLDTVGAKDWVVYSQPPFAGPETVVDYLGRYTHRVAISNHRIRDVSEGQVTFTYRDRREGNVVKVMTLPAHEFIRRFLLHVLPYGFQRIRHFGILANRYKAQALGRCRALLGLDPALPKPEPKTPREWMLELTGQDVTRCPRCGSGTLRPVRGLPLLGPQAQAGQEPALHDSS
jgi:hypothetical protein